MLKGLPSRRRPQPAYRAWPTKVTPAKRRTGGPPSNWVYVPAYQCPHKRGDLECHHVEGGEGQGSDLRRGGTCDQPHAAGQKGGKPYPWRS